MIFPIFDGLVHEVKASECSPLWSLKVSLFPKQNTLSFSIQYHCACKQTNKCNIYLITERTQVPVNLVPLHPTTTHPVQGNVNVLQVFWAFVKPRLGQQSAVLHASLMFFGSLAAELTCKSKNSKLYKLLDVLLLSINLNIKTADNLTF